ncbi:MAG: apolipoprotein N-acyltransferase [Sulfurovum sp.]|nr:MAG: apolipoprotein N-acyltransferase [Sulfurovum sp.]
MGNYFTIYNITTGFVIAILSSLFIYLEYVNFTYFFINTIIGLMAIYWLLWANRMIWFWSGWFIGLLWFWWISLSFIHYEMPIFIPLVIISIALIYGITFLILFKIAHFFTNRLEISEIYGKALILFLFSYIHPIEFDWFKPELMFTNSYLGIEKWQFAIILSALALTQIKKNIIFLTLLILAYPFITPFTLQKLENIKLISTYTTIEDKWNEQKQPTHMKAVFNEINLAIAQKKEVIVFPESVFPLFINLQPQLMDALKKLSKDITIVAGALYWEPVQNIPRNSAFIFKNGDVMVAHKVLLVPFGEQNPLPNFMSKWVNEFFFDGAKDYIASSNISDYEINGTKYRNAICFEATSERLYENSPKTMIAMSNNGWFVPSIEPTLQQILFQYYSKKYGTTIYHSVNMSKSYIVQNGKVIYP